MNPLTVRRTAPLGAFSAALFLLLSSGAAAQGLPAEGAEVQRAPSPGDPASPVPSAPRDGLKIYISADQEGVGGAVSEFQLTVGGVEWERFRRHMTAEVNAAVEAAFEAGATEVVVSDSHGSGQNLITEDLHPDVRLIRSWPRKLIMMEGIDETFDAAILIGYHASEGVADAIAAHTMAGTKIAAIRLNGITVPEGGFNAAIAGHFGVPVVMVSGDQTATAEVRSLLGDVEEAVVKWAIGNRSAETMHPTRAQELIAHRTRAALGRLGDFRPYRPWEGGDQGRPGPVTLEIDFKSETDAEMLAYLSSVERLSGSSIRFQARDMLEASGFVAVVIHYNRF
jgi:D-amino peptidase